MINTELAELYGELSELMLETAEIERKSKVMMYTWYGLQAHFHETIGSNMRKIREIRNQIAAFDRADMAVIDDVIKAEILDEPLQAILAEDLVSLRGK